jgi:hypothetical protein
MIPISFCNRFGKHAALGCFAAVIPTTALADNPAATVQVDANANRRPISPLIYGANWIDQATIDDLNLTVNRRGGNATTTYNWQINATNRAGDWYFESLSEGEGAVPSGAADSFINFTKAGGAETMMTIPMVDWVAKLGPNREGLTPYSVAKYGAQTASDPWWPDAGNGIRASDGSQIVSDPNDAYVPNSPAFQKVWVEHMVNTFGSSTNGGVKYYLTDNEHGVWPWNHRPIVPVGPTMDSIRDRIIAYAGMVKEVDPDAQIVGPEEWGWPNYFSSPYDTQFPGGADRAAHGGWDYMPWLLKELKAHEDSTGKRLLDVFSLHYYPQYNEFGEGDSSTAAQLKRNECTRDLWDPNYFSTSWVSNTVKLIPRMKDWVNAHYPGTKLAITEYSWGAEGHISGAIAQADVLGIFGREGVDIATFWGGVNNTAPIYQAFKIYRNYDGLKSTFGDTSVSASVANPDNVAAFAAQRDSDDALTVMVVCKHLADPTPVAVNLANFTAGGAAQVWQFTGANTVSRLSDVAVINGTVSFSAPPQSVTLLVVPGSNTPPSEMRARYAFEASAQDSSGNGFHGTATAVTYTTGKVGSQAAQFDGSGGSVTIPPSVTDDFTVTMWVKTTDTAGTADAQWWNGKGLVDGEIGGGGADWGTSIVDGKFVLGVGAPGGDITVASSVNINDGTWHHVAATRNNTSGAMQVYVDGVLSGSGTGPTGPRNWPTSLRIGGLQPGYNFLNGALDEVRLYDRILTAEEIAESSGLPPVAPTGFAAAAGSGGIALSWSASAIAAEYHVKRSTTAGTGHTTITTVTGTTFTDTAVEEGTTYYYVVTAANASGESGNSAEIATRTDALVLHLKLDETSGSTAADSSGFDRTATLVNGPAFTTGRLGNALAFTGASSQHAALPTGVVSTLSDFTVSAWVNPSTLDTWSRVFDFGSGTETNMFLTTRSWNNNRPRFGIKIGGSAEQIIDAADALATGTWTHVAITLSGSTGTLYLNGVASGSNNAITFDPAGMGGTTQNYLGRSQWPDPYFNGTLDDFRIYSRALSPAEVEVLAAGEFAAPQNVTATPGNGQISLSWNTVDGAAGYIIRRSADSSGPYIELATGIPATNFTDSEVSDEATWYYTIAAHGLPGTGVPSVPVTATAYTAVENWRFGNFGTTVNSGAAADNADPDGDGWTNEQEFIGGTDPNSSSSLLKIHQMQASGNDMNLSFPSVLGRTYRVERSDTLLEESWITVQDNIPGTGGFIGITDTGGAAQQRRFYRIVVGW